MTTKTALFDVHESLGATFTEFAGWTMPLRYTSETAEHRAVREAAGLFDLSHMGQIIVSGGQADEALDFALVGNIAGIEVGRARYTMMCRADGGIVDDLIAYRLAPERYMVVANASNAPAVEALLRERSSDFEAEVEVERLWDRCLIGVQGPASPSILRELVKGADIDELKYYAVYSATMIDRDILLARTGYTGEDGFEIYCADKDAVALWQRIEEAGSRAGLLAAGLSCRDTLRLEAGMPLYGNELTTSRTPYEVGLGRVVKLDKAGDFVGRDALEAVAERPSDTALVGLVLTGRRVARSGHLVLDPVSGAVIGEVTSGAPSPTRQQPIAMALIDAGHSAPGTELVVDIRGAQEPAAVVELPFYRRAR